jgi:lysophospholipase L1-like esterase
VHWKRKVVTIRHFWSREGVAGAVRGALSTLLLLACAASAADRAPVPDLSYLPPIERSRVPAPLPPPAARIGPPSQPAGKRAPPLAFQGFPQLSRAAEAFDALGRGLRSQPVRVLWLGDSHTAADHLTGSVRALLFERFGPGGPGFLRLGLAPTRHEHASLQRIGMARTEPSPPSRRAPQADGMFGLGGMRISVLERSELRLKVLPGAIAGRARHTLLYDLPAGSRFTLALGRERRTISTVDPRLSRSGSPVQRLEIEGEATDTLVIDVVAGAPRFYGAIVEGSEPGVVLDAIGIDGARVGTALAWDGPAFEAELADRRPDLFVLAFGTNEAFDGVRVDRYQGELERLLERFRRGAPGADCVILGPPDALTRAGTPVRRVPEISDAYESVARRAGCAFVSQQELMGGFGSFATWAAERPPFAFSDGLHLTRRGYQRLGALLFGALFDAPASAPVSSRSR